MYLTGQHSLVKRCKSSWWMTPFTLSQKTINIPISNIVGVWDIYEWMSKWTTNRQIRWSSFPQERKRKFFTLSLAHCPKDRFLLGRCNISIWRVLIRKKYSSRCKILENSESIELSQRQHVCLLKFVIKLNRFVLFI